MSQVRNLRAMFEQKGETSPPDRGRSPGIPPPAAATSESPRPLSKVRTNFIAVEKDGRIGLQRDPSSESIVSSRRVSSGTDGETAPSVTDRTDGPADRADRATTAGAGGGTKAGPVLQPVPQPPAQEPTGREAPAPGAAAAGEKEGKDGKGPGEEKSQGNAGDAPGPKENGQRSESGPAPSKPDARVPTGGAGASRADAAPSAGAGAGAGANGAREETRNGAGGHGAASLRSTSKDAPAKVAGTAHKSAPKALSTTKANSKAVARPLAKTPTAPVKPQAPKSPSKTPEKRAEAVDKSETPKPPASAAKSTASNTRKPPSLQVSPSNGSTSGGAGFVKPRPKSPTKPVKLPPGLTTHTASSATKVNAPRQSLSRQSGSYHTVHSLGRSPSRASVSTSGPAVPGAPPGPKNLKRQLSNINRPRPSLGPPPKQPAKDHPVTKKEKQVDEGFLARMMRPTQASASKTAEKVSLTPPRKQPAPAAAHTRGPPMMRDLKKHTGAKKIVPKAGGAQTAQESTQPSVSAAEEVAPTVGQTASAEEAVAIVKEAEGTASFDEAVVEPVQEKVDHPPEPVVEIHIAETPEEEHTPEAEPEAELEAEGEAASEALSEQPTVVEPEPEVELAEEGLPAVNGEHVEAKGEEPTVSHEEVVEAKAEEEHQKEEVATVDVQEHAMVNGVDSKEGHGVEAAPVAEAEAEAEAGSVKEAEVDTTAD